MSSLLLPFCRNTASLGFRPHVNSRANVHVPANLKGAALQLNIGRASPGSTGHTTKSRLQEWPTPAPTVCGLYLQLTITRRRRTDPRQSPAARPLAVCGLAHSEAPNREATMAPRAPRRFSEGRDSQAGCLTPAPPPDRRYTTLHQILSSHNIEFSCAAESA